MHYLYTFFIYEIIQLNKYNFIGAGDIPKSRTSGKLRGVRLAAQVGYYKLIKGGSALDAVEEAGKF